jgi:hypothetical protein
MLLQSQRGPLRMLKHGEGWAAQARHPANCMHCSLLQVPLQARHSPCPLPMSCCHRCCWCCCQRQISC